MIFTLSLSVPTFMILVIAFVYEPDLRDYWIERKNKMIEKYMARHDGISEKALND